MLSVSLTCGIKRKHMNSFLYLFGIVCHREHSGSLIGHLTHSDFSGRSSPSDLSRWWGPGRGSNVPEAAEKTLAIKHLFKQSII